MERAPEYSGQRLTIRCVELANGACPVGEFLDDLDDKKRTKLDVIFEVLGDHPGFHNRKRFKKVEKSDGIFEIKSHQIRILGFYAPGRRLILAHAVVKKGDNLKKADIRKVEEIKRWFFENLEGDR